MNATLRIIVVAAFALSFSAVDGTAEPLSAEAAVELFLKATAKERSNPAFSYETNERKGDRTTTAKHYSFRRPDGKNLLRIERTSVTPFATYLTIDIANDSGFWTIIGDYAIRMPKRDNEVVAAAAAYREELRDRKEESAPPDRFSGEMVARSGRSFAVVTREMSAERQRQQAELTRRVAGQQVGATSPGLSNAQANYRHKKELDAIEQKISARFEYVIDLESGLIVETRTYNSAGGLLRQTVRQNLKVEADLPADFFETPAHCKKHFPASSSAYSSLRREATFAQGVAWRAKNKPKKEQKKQ